MKKKIIITAAIILTLGMLGYGAYCVMMAYQVTRAAERIEEAKRELAEEIKNGEYAEEISEYLGMVEALNDTEPDRWKTVVTETEAADETENHIYKINNYTWLENGMHIALLSCGPYVPKNEFAAGPDDGNRFVSFEVYVENGGDYAEGISCISFDCYADGYKMQRCTSGDNDLDAELTPGRGTTGNLYFEVPEDAEELRLRYQWGNLDGDYVEFLYEEGKRSLMADEPPTRVRTEDALEEGKTAKTENFEIKFIGQGEVFDGAVKPKDGYESRKFEFDIKNVSRQEQSILFDCYFRCYADGEYCGKTLTLFDPRLYDKVAAGKKIQGPIAFDVPTDAEVIEIEAINQRDTSQRLTFRARG